LDLLRTAIDQWDAHALSEAGAMLTIPVSTSCAFTRSLSQVSVIEIGSH
jgi:hypothetical protein